MRILRILVVRVSRACTGQHQTCVLAQFRHALSAAGHDIQADKVAALGVGPVGNIAAGGEVGGKSGLDGIEAGHQTAAVLCHVCQNALLVLQEADVAQLVHLIVADDHH